MGKNFNLRPYSINDFREWSERRELILSPKFQRRRVWSEKAKSYLIDTILRGLPMPPIFIRQQIDPKTRKTAREVIDGQQRLGAILDFLKDGFKISKIHNEEYSDLFFSELPSGVQRDFLEYEMSTNLVLSSKDEEVLGIFARLNTYTVKLNKQELWNAKYFGLFKQTVHSLAYEFYTFWRNSNILTENRIARMGDVELTSELIIASIDGIQDKSSVENYYRKYDDEFPDRDKSVQRFKKCMDSIGEIYAEVLPNSYFNGIPSFYTLYCVIYDLLFGLKNSRCEVEMSIRPSHYPKIRVALQNLETVLEEVTRKSDVQGDVKQFIDDCTRHTTVLQARKRRHAFLLKFILGYLREKK